MSPEGAFCNLKTFDNLEPEIQLSNEEIENLKEELETEFPSSETLATISSLNGPTLTQIFTIPSSLFFANPERAAREKIHPLFEGQEGEMVQAH